MTTLERILQDATVAMKNKEADRLSTLRMLKTALKNRQIELMHPLTEEETLAVVKSQVKQLKEGLEMAQKAQRVQMIEAAEREIALLETYLPEQMSDEELGAIISAALTQEQITSKADTGRAMGVAMKAIAGRADGSRVKLIVSQILTVFALVGIGLLSHPSVLHAAGLASSSSGFFVENSLRIVRVFLMLLGIICINLILIGGFTYMIASGRDDIHKEAIGKVTIGIIGTIITAVLFAFASIYLSEA